MSRMRLLIVSGRTHEQGGDGDLGQGEALVEDGGQEPVGEGEHGAPAGAGGGGRGAGSGSFPAAGRGGSAARRSGHPTPVHIVARRGCIPGRAGLWRAQAAGELALLAGFCAR